MTDLQPADIIDARGLMCVQVLLLLRRHIADLVPGTVVAVATDDPAAPIDLPAWCHLTGHTYLGCRMSEHGAVHTVRVAETAVPTEGKRPWAIRR